VSSGVMYNLLILGAPGRTWGWQQPAKECRHQALERLGALVTCLESPRTICEPQQQVWEHLQSQYSTLGITSFSVGTLLLCQDIIATTYHSMLFQIDVISLYSHLCTYIASHLHTVYLNCLPAAIVCNLQCV
jgi:hypothetical protein